MSNLFDLSGKTAIVTGSSRGIGRAIAEALADAGARVVISSRKQASCEDVAAAINARHGEGRATPIEASISNKAALEALVRNTKERIGPIDILICNAASNPYYGPTLGINDDQFRKILENNILSNHWLAQLVAPSMIERKSGSIVIVSSIGAYIGSGTIGTYHLSKAADLAMVRNLAVEFGPHKVRVNAISPGVTRTDFAKALWEDPAKETAFSQQIPLRRIGEPGEMAGAALFLASDASSYVTGQAIVVDGGMTIAPVA
ncbi:SDR family NAD(P)-dependent oxidoreductase [Sphingobium ummariense]